ncbi:hypothetical protein LY78DRAFT_189139 [Colletotrichum sublineola]|nr:hypothetical protein LY78DRAFT_189139 [Colletotrichum sublineola]
MVNQARRLWDESQSRARLEFCRVREDGMALCVWFFFFFFFFETKRDGNVCHGTLGVIGDWHSRIRLPRWDGICPFTLCTCESSLLAGGVLISERSSSEKLDTSKPDGSRRSLMQPDNFLLSRNLILHTCRHCHAWPTDGYREQMDFIRAFALDSSWEILWL